MPARNIEDSEVVIDGNLVTSRTAEDLPAFCRASHEKFREPRGGLNK